MPRTSISLFSGDCSCSLPVPINNILMWFYYGAFMVTYISCLWFSGYHFSQIYSSFFLPKSCKCTNVQWVFLKDNLLISWILVGVLFLTARKSGLYSLLSLRSRLNIHFLIHICTLEKNVKMWFYFSME